MAEEKFPFFSYFSDVEEGLTTAVIKAATRGRENDTSRSTILAPTLQETEIVPTKTTMSVITNGKIYITIEILGDIHGTTIFRSASLLESYDAHCDEHTHN